MMTPLPARADTLAATDRIRPYVRRTPIWQLPLAALLEGAPSSGPAPDAWVTLKLEHHQVGGSFKARGMFNRLLANPIPRSGVIVASGGNAGIATAVAAKALGVRCEVFVPTLSSPAKQAALRALGAELQVTGDAYAQALEACLVRQRETGALMTHAYDQPEVVAGAATLAQELDKQLASLDDGRPLDSVLVSVGGGGLVAGLATWHAATDTRVVALEPELAPTLAQALAAAGPVDVQVSGVAADSLGAKRLGTLAWQALQAKAPRSLTLSDNAITEARLWMWQHLHLAVEPAAALPVAALRCGAYRPRPGEHLALIICGANTDPSSLTTAA
jgi:threonine dehydratase